jgi:hypothetical protein
LPPFGRQNTERREKHESTAYCRTSCRNGISNRFNDGGFPWGITFTTSSTKCRSFPRLSKDTVDVGCSVNRTHGSIFLIFLPFISPFLQFPPSTSHLPCA